MFKTEEEVRVYAKVNGFDEAGINNEVEKWKNSKIVSDDIEDDFTDIDEE